MNKAGILIDIALIKEKKENGGENRINIFLRVDSKVERNKQKIK